MFRRSTRALVHAAMLAGLVLVVYGQPAAVAQAPQTPALPAARTIVKRHLDAIGGERAYKAMQSLHAKGTISLPAQQIKGDLDVFAARPNKQLVRATIPAIGRTETGYDGKVGWSIDPVQGATLLTGRQLSEMADDAWFDSPFYEAPHVKDIVTIGREDFDGRPAYRLKVTFASGNEQFEFFDVETGLQLGSESRRETVLGVVPSTSFAREYKTFGALKLATSIVQKALGFEQVATVTTYEFNAVPAETFVLPPQIKALIKAPEAARR